MIMCYDLVDMVKVHAFDATGEEDAAMQIVEPYMQFFMEEGHPEEGHREEDHHPS